MHLFTYNKASISASMAHHVHECHRVTMPQVLVPKANQLDTHSSDNHDRSAASRVRQSIGWDTVDWKRRHLIAADVRQHSKGVNQLNAFEGVLGQRPKGWRTLGGRCEPRRRGTGKTIIVSKRRARSHRDFLDGNAIQSD